MGGDAIVVNEQWLRERFAGRADDVAPARAYEVAESLKNLSVWWLRPEVLQKAANHARAIGLHNLAQRWEREPQLPQEQGACWIALVNKAPQDIGLLRPAYVLPLGWARLPAHDARLPSGLLRLADEVREELENLDEVSPDWTLHAAPKSLLRGLDLSSLDGSWDSAFAPLAAGLLLAAWEGMPDPTLWASGAWQRHQGIRPVEGLEEKLALAADFKAKQFFVPEEQSKALDNWAKERKLQVEISPLHQNETDLRNKTDLRKALGQYFESLELPIGKGPHLQKQRADHFLRIRNKDRANKFYKQHILPEVIERIHKQLASQQLLGKRVITIVSDSFDTIKQVATAMRAKACLLLHDKDMEDKAKKQKQELEGNLKNCDVVTHLIEGNEHEDLRRAFLNAVNQFASDQRPEELVFDLTSGMRIMNLALYDSVPQNSYLICIQTQFDRGSRRPRPYTEYVHVWAKKTPPSG